MSSEEIAVDFVHSMLSGDVEKMELLLEESISWYPPTSVAAYFNGVVIGRREVIAFLTENPAMFYEPNSRKAEIINAVGNEQFASVNFKFIATPKKGGTLNTCANFMFEFSGKKIVKVWEVLDMAEWNSSVLQA